MGLRIKRDDEVKVMVGKDKGARGRVLKVLKDQSRVIVGGVNMVKRHQRTTQQQTGIVEKEAPIHVSNVMLVDPKAEAATRVRTGRDKDGRKVRVSVKTGSVLDN